MKPVHLCRREVNAKMVIAIGIELRYIESLPRKWPIVP